MRRTGAAIARKFATAYPVILLARSNKSIDPLKAEIEKAGGQAFGVQADVSDAKSVENAFSVIEKEFPGYGIAAAVFNVGGTMVRKPFLEITSEEWIKPYEANGFVFIILQPLTIQNWRLQLFTCCYSTADKV
jgi:NAD(P)-dependent dehydrogenase (short-subunit alcohol dehydrogenase family)